MNRKRQLVMAVAALVLVAAMLACGPGGGAEAASVTITSPASGTTVQMGQNVQIASTAAADAGVARVELLVNGQVVRTDAPPSGTPTTFSLIQPWTPIAAGEVTVSVIAYDTADTPSEPAAITVNVTAAVADVTPTPEADVAGPGGCTLNGAYAADVTIPDDTQLAPGTAFVKTWRIRNSGTCDWGEGFTLAFVSGDQMGAPGSVTVPATAAGSTVDVSVNMVAPMTPGTYRGNWQLRSDEGQVFGSTVYVRIIVPSPITPTPTQAPAINNLRATVEANESVTFTWDDLPAEAQYRYEFSFVAGDAGAATSSSLAANTTSWNSGVLGCGASGGFTLIGQASGGAEIARGTVNFTIAACAISQEVQVGIGADAYWWPQNMMCMIGGCPDFLHGESLQLTNLAMNNLFYSGLVALYFDVTGIPASATVQEATLYLYLNEASGATGVNVAAGTITNFWSEEDHSIRPACDTAGASSRNVGTGTGWYDWDVTAIIQQHIANESINHGICLRGGDSGDSRTFSSREGSAIRQPYLRVTYTP